VEMKVSTMAVRISRSLSPIGCPVDMLFYIYAIPKIPEAPK
jgi:hypothetical protein